MKKMIFIMMLILLFGIDKAKGSVIVEFSEVTLTSPTLLDGTTYFDDYGLSFEDTTYWGIDDRVIGSGVDNVGIGPTSEPDTIMTVVFTDEAYWVSVDWMTITNAVIWGTAFDSSGTILDMQSASGLEDINHGNFLFSEVGNIYKITFGDNYTAVGRLEFDPIPEPCTLFLLLIGGGLLGTQRKV